MKFKILLLFIIAPLFLQAQMVVTPISNLPVYRQNQSLIHNPWTGGINAAEVSVIDADYDGEENDLFIFDKNGDRILIFTGSTLNNERIYTYRPELARNFPPIKAWALMRDYDCDGNDDIFTYSPFGGAFAVYRNTGTAESGLEFELVQPSLQSYYQFTSNQFSTNIYVSSQDVPAIFDFDGDGDLDILTFSVSGTMVELHLNYSVETTGLCDVDTFALRNRCYGRFVEGSESNGVITDSETVDALCNFNVVNPKSNSNSGKGARHVGSTILAFDATQDGLVEIILGDVSYKNMTYLENNERPEPMVDSVGVVITNFPANFNAPAVDIDNFPAGFYEDIDGDGIRDLIVGVNNTGLAANKQSVWYYKNNGVDDLPDFELIQKNFLQDQTIETGEAAAPAFFDYNGDGLQDMVIGSRGEFLGLAEFNPTLSLYVNTGNATNPEFTLEDDDWLNISTLDIGQYITPTFGDLNGDGDIDMIVGCASGEIYLFENTAGAGSVASFILSGNITSNNESIDVGQNSSPQLFDLNQNGKLDLVIGERNGNLNYYENTGTTANPQFTLSSELLGGITSVEPNFFIGNSSPYFYSYNNETYLALGGEAGRIHLYTGIDNNISGNFELVDYNAFGVDVGLLSKPIILDINSDGIPDLFCGSIGGGINLYMGDYLVGINQIDSKLFKLEIYPNPAKSHLNIQLPIDEAIDSDYAIYSLSGKVVQRGATKAQQVDVNKLSSGMYILEMVLRDEVYRGKFVRE